MRLRFVCIQLFFYFVFVQYSVLSFTVIINNILYSSENSICNRLLFLLLLFRFCCSYGFAVYEHRNFDTCMAYHHAKNAVIRISVLCARAMMAISVLLIHHFWPLWPIRHSLSFPLGKPAESIFNAVRLLAIPDKF